MRTSLKKTTNKKKKTEKLKRRRSLNLRKKPIFCLDHTYIYTKGNCHVGNTQDSFPLIFLQLLPIITFWLVGSTLPAWLMRLLAQSSGSSFLIFRISTSQLCSPSDPKELHLGFSISQHYFYSREKPSCLWAKPLLFLILWIPFTCQILLFFNTPDLATTPDWFWYLKVAMPLSFSLSCFLTLFKGFHKAPEEFSLVALRSPI